MKLETLINAWKSDYANLPEHNDARYDRNKRFHNRLIKRLNQAQIKALYEWRLRSQWAN